MATAKTIGKVWSAAGLPDAQLAEQRATLEYITAQAADLGLSLARLDLLKYFGTGDGRPVLTTERKQLNRQLRSLLSEPLAVQLPQTLPEAVRDAILEMGTEFTTRHNYAKRKALEEAHSLNRSMRYWLRSARQNAGVDPTKKAAAVVGALETVLSAGWWTQPMIVTQTDDWWPHTKRTVLWLATPPITLHHTAPKAGLALAVPMGRFAVRFKLWEAAYEPEVLPYADNITPKNGVVGEGYYHPHVDSEYNVCWGDAYEAATSATMMDDMQTLLMLLQAVLTTYSPTNPFVSLDKFVKGQKFERNEAVPYVD